MGLRSLEIFYFFRQILASKVDPRAVRVRVKFKCLFVIPWIKAYYYFFFIDKIFNTIVIKRHVIRIKKHRTYTVDEIKISINKEIKISIIFIMFIKSNNITAQQAQHICTALIQCRTSVGDAGPTLHQCHTNAVRPLRGSTGPVPALCWRTKNQHRLSTSYIQQTRRLDQGIWLCKIWSWSTYTWYRNLIHI